MTHSAWGEADLEHLPRLDKQHRLRPAATRTVASIGSPDMTAVLLLARRTAAILARQAPGAASRESPVTVDSGRPGATTDDLEAVLLEAKLSVPHRRAGSVSRADLIETARDARVPGGRDHGAGGLRQVDVPR